MIFNEATFFALFLLPCVIAFHLTRAERRAWAIVFFGALFFGYYGYLHFGGIAGALVVAILGWEVLVSRLYAKGSRWCVFGVVQALLILCVFKYLPFFSRIWTDVGFSTGAPLARWVLPLGISFFTFEFIHYAVDCYSGRVKAAPISRYAAFIFFFPTMVAGPIKRFGEFSASLAETKWDPALASRGITRILCGLAKKHILSDTIAMWSNNLMTDAVYGASALDILVWIFAYGLRLYLDFSGYSDIAIGCAALFGIRVPENFNWPYFSANVQEFWRRWHISLSTWFRDYVFIPLGGSRRALAQTALVVFTVFFLSGLWHGAEYNFIAWGTYHGLLMAAYLVWKRTPLSRRFVLPRAVAIAITFVIVNLGWGFFSMDMQHARVAYAKLLGLQGKAS